MPDIPPSNLDEDELAMLEIILRFGGTINKRTLKLKLESKGLDYDEFLDKLSSLISIQRSRSEEVVKIDSGEVRKLLASSGRPLISHHGQMTRRSWRSK